MTDLDDLLAAPSPATEACAREGCGHEEGAHARYEMFPGEWVSECYGLDECPCTGYQPATPEAPR